MKKIISLVLSVVMLLGVFLMPSFAATQRESENNNSIGRANQINLNNTVSGYISEHDDDFFKFTLSIAGKVTFNIKIDAKDYWDDGWFNLYNASGAEDCDGSTGLCSFDENFGYIKEEYVFMLQPGTYYAKLGLTTNKSDSFSYTIANTFESSNCNYFEPDDNLKNAHNIAIGKKITGQLDTVFEDSDRNYDRDYDYYVFKLDSTLKIKFSFNEYTNFYGYKNGDTECVIYQYKDSQRISDYLYEGNNTQTITLSAGTYYIKVSGDPRGESSYSIQTSVYVSKPSGFKCTARTTSAEKVAWNKVAGVTGYQVQCSDGGSNWAQNKVTSGNSTVFSGLVAGGKYKFRVRAYKKIDGVNYFSAWSPTLNSCAKPATVTLKGVSSPKHTQIKTTWAKAGGVVSGYQIYYGKNASFTLLAAKKNVSGKSTTSYTGKNFTKGRTYYVKVRTYTVFNGVTYYGAWSATKKVKSK